MSNRRSWVGSVNSLSLGVFLCKAEVLMVPVPRVAKKVKCLVFSKIGNLGFPFNLASNLLCNLGKFTSPL